MAAALRGKWRGWNRKKGDSDGGSERGSVSERERQTWHPALSTSTDLAQQCGCH